MGLSVLKLDLTHEEAALVGAALANMPYRQVAQLLANLEQQIRAQVEQAKAVEDSKG
jgi:hypothetical protein